MAKKKKTDPLSDRNVKSFLEEMEELGTAAGMFIENFQQLATREHSPFKDREITDIEFEDIQ